MPLVSSLANLADEIRRRIGCWVEQNPEGAARIALWIEEQMDPSEQAEAPVDFFHSFMRALVPHNWWTLTIGMHGRVQRFMTETGICLVWVPPAEVVEAVVRETSKDARDEVLLANAPLIRDAVDQALVEATHPQLAVTVAAAREALDAQRAGFYKASQSHIASVLGDVIEQHFGFKGFGNARRAFEDEPVSSAGLWSSRRAAIQEAIRVAIVESKYRPPDAGFNRHLSAHGVDPKQFCEAHALEGLMLLAGAIRELHEIYRLAELGFGPSPRLDKYARGQLQRRIERAAGEQDPNPAAAQAILS